MSNPPPPAVEGVTPESVDAFVVDQWPARNHTSRCLEVSGRHALAEITVGAEQIRPGGYISGPTQFAAADLALWYACFGAIGLEAMAVTSELSIRFLRPAFGELLLARADLHSVGRRQISGTVLMWTDDPDKPVSISQGSYVAPV
jgi:acyl-coenzyme A thioesterase PaaI-like protein